MQTLQQNAVNNDNSVDTSDSRDVSTTHHDLKHAAEEDGHCSHSRNVHVCNCLSVRVFM